jgi:hypothetical protein
MDVDYSNFEKEDFSINGFYRAFVEDNVDPLSVGRLRVRILGIHSMDILEAPTENLPWAEPVIPIAYSGGANLQNIDVKPGVSAVPQSKYVPAPVVAPLAQQIPTTPTDSVNKATTEFVTIPIHQDANLCNSGTGGHFAVPAKGSLVWVFFDGGCHLRPHYFAMATQARDWKAQKLKMQGDIVDRENIITTLFSTLSAASDVAPHKFTGTATPSSEVKTALQAPTYTPTGNTFDLNNRTENLTSWTTPGGTTILVNHTWGKEQLYIIHKGYSQFIDEKGQVTKVVGHTAPTPVNTTTALNPTNASGLANDETEINAGLKNLYIIGDYNMLTVGNCVIQCNSNVQINAMSNVGVVARQGNVNVLAELGSINLEASKASINLKALDIQFEADNNITFKSKNSIDMNAVADVQMKSNGKILLESTNIESKATGAFSVDATSSVNLKAAGISTYSSDGGLTITSSKTSVNGDTLVLINSALVEIKGTGGVNIEGTTTNIKGATVNVNGDGVVSILGATTNVYGTGAAMIGGTIATMGGAITNITGILTLGIGSVIAGPPATPVSNTFTKPEIPPVNPYVESPFVPAAADIPIVATPSQIV